MTLFKKISLAILILINTLFVNAQNVYVDTNFSGISDGTEVSPYKTIQDAADNMSSGDICIIKAGTYREKVTLVGKHGLTFTNFGDDYVLITGLDTAVSHTPHEGNIIKVPFTKIDIDGRNNVEPQVFYKGERQNLARFPNEDGYLFNTQDWTSTTTSYVNNVATVEFDSSEFLQYATNDLIGAFYIGLNNKNNPGHSFLVARGEVTAVNGKTLTCIPAVNPWKTNNYAAVGAGKGYVIGSYNLIDTPGEWYYDETDELLYFQVEDLANFNFSDLEIRKRLHGFEIDASHNTIIKGLHFKAASVGIYYSNNCVIEESTFRYITPFVGDVTVPEYGSQANNDTRGIRITGNNNIVRSCYFGGSWRSLINLFDTNPKTTGNSNVVENCLIENGNWQGERGGLIFCNGDHNIIKNNTIRYGGNAGIDMGNTSADLTGEYGKNANGLGIDAIISSNLVSDVCLINSDCGAFYTNHQGEGPDSTTIISNNIFSTGIRSDQTALAGIYIDNASSGYHIQNNIVHHSMEGVRFNHRGKNNKFYNNTLYEVNENVMRYAIDSDIDDEFELQVYNNLSVSAEEVDKEWSVSFGNNSQPADIVDFQNNFNMTNGEVNFTSVNDLDFTIDSDSRSIDLGIPHELTGSEVSDGLPDVGAYEFGAGVRSTGSTVTRPYFPDEPNYGSTLPKRVAYYSFEGSTQIVNDYASKDSNNDAGYLGGLSSTESDDPIRLSDGFSGKGIEFPNGDETLTIIPTDEINLSVEMSVSMFFKLNKSVSQQSNAYPSLLNKQDFLASEGYALLFTKSNETLAFRVLGDGQYQDVVHDVSNLEAGIWHHVAGTFDGKEMHLYLDGVRVQTVSSSVVSKIDSNNEFLRFGNRSFEGAIDEVSIYNYALTEYEVMNLSSQSPKRVAYYTFEGNDQIVNDYASTDLNNDAGYLGGLSSVESDDPVRSSNGFLGKGIKFPNGNETVNILPTYELNPSKTMSVSMFFNLDKSVSQQSSSYPSLLNKQEFGDRQGYALLFTKSNETLAFRVLGDGNYQDVVYDVSNLEIGIWHHVAGTFDGTEMHLYLNGVKVQTVSNSIVPWIDPSSQFLRFGNRSFEGDIDEVSIYNYVLTEYEVMNLSFNSPKRVAYYSFEGNTQIVNDYASTDLNNDAGYLGGLSSVESDDPVRSSNGFSGQGITFPNGNETVNILPTYELNPSKAMSVSMFFNLDKSVSQQSNSYPSLLNKQEFGDRQGYALLFTKSNETLAFRVLGDGNYQDVLYDVSSLIVGNWYHVVGTFDGTEMNLYLDGVKVQTVSNSAVPWIDPSSQLLRFGNRSFEGAIDEVSIYNYALTSDEVELIHNDYSSSARLGLAKEDLSKQLNNSAIFYPNPSQGEITFVSEKFIGQKVNISDLTGRTINSCHVSENSSVDLKYLPNGIYIVRVWVDDEVYTERLLIEY